jgi:O-antigen/teichoic acid export membrane protein
VGADKASLHRQRHRRIVVTGASSGVARIVSLVVALVSVRLAVHTLGVEDFGVYVALAAVVNLLSFLDVGIGNALIREVAAASVDREDDATLATLVSSAFFPLVVLVSVAGSVFAAALAAVDLTQLLNTPPSFSRSELAGLAFLAFVPFVLSLPLGIVVRVRYGLQEGHVSNAWQAAGFGVQLVLVGVAASAGAGLPVFVVLLGLGRVLGYLADLVALWMRHGWSRPRLRSVEAGTARRLLTTGLAFFVLSISAAVGYQTDALVISHFRGSSETTTYAVTFQLAMICPALLSLFLNALWPAYSEAEQRGDRPWIQRTFARSFALSVPVAVVAAAVLVVAAPAIIEVWIGQGVDPPSSLLWASALFIVVNALTAPLAALLNGIGLVRQQAVAAMVMAVSNVALSIALVQRLGIAGPVLATSLTQLVCLVMPLGWFAFRSVYGAGASD